MRECSGREDLTKVSERPSIGLTITPTDSQQREVKLKSYIIYIFISPS